MELDLDRMNSFRWWHSIELPGGVITPGQKKPQDHRLESEIFFGPVDLRGKTLIDIGAWNGAYSFEAVRRGAKRVLAVDHNTWIHPEIRGRESFDFANAALGNKVEARILDISVPLPHDIGKFDVVLFAGVFYHLREPIAALRQAASLAEELLIVETHIDGRDYPRPMMVHYPTTELGGDATNWWAPNEACMFALLKDLGFVEIDTSLTYGNRGTFHAWRTTKNRLRGPMDQYQLTAPITLSAKAGWRDWIWRWLRFSEP